MTIGAATTHSRDAQHGAVIAQAEIGKLVDDTIRAYKASAKDRAAMHRSPARSKLHDLLFDVELFSDDVAGYATSIASRGWHSRAGEAMDKLSKYDAYAMLAQTSDYPRYRRYIIAVDYLRQQVLDFFEHGVAAPRSGRRPKPLGK